MSSRVSAQIEQVETHLEAIRAHLPKVRELAQEQQNELLEESLGILDVCLGSLDSSLSENRLAALPISALAQAAKQTKSVADTTANTLSNFDGHAANLTNQIDSLHNRLWVDRLIDPHAEIRAHKSAVGELDAAMATVREQMEELRGGLADRKRAEDAAKRVAELQDEVAKLVTEAQAKKREIDGLATKAETVHGILNTKVTEIDQLLEQAKTSRTAVTALEADLKKWHGEMGAARKAIEDLHDLTTTKLETYDRELTVRKETLDGFHKRIKEQFTLASSGALAESFSQRGRVLFWGKVGWGATAFLAYVFFVGFAIWVMLETIPGMLSPAEDPGTGTSPVAPPHGTFDWALFLVRLSVTIPIGLMVWFLTVQYGKARRVQESYAFKGVVASSFDAYRDLVEKIATDPALKADPEYAKFIRETIERIYTAPPMGREDDDNPPHTRALKDLPGVLKSMAEFMERTKRL